MQVYWYMYISQVSGERLQDHWSSGNSLTGVVDALQHVASHLDQPVYGFQCTEDVPQNSIADMAAFYVKVTVQQIFHKEA